MDLSIPYAWVNLHAVYDLEALIGFLPYFRMPIPRM